MRTFFVLALGGMILALTGCDKSSGPSSPSTGSMQVNMVDAPAAYEAVVVVVDSVQAHMAGSDSTSGWVLLSSTPQQYDLLAYTNGNVAVIGSSQIPAGHYTQIRLLLGSGCSVTSNGQMYPMTVPSGMQSGLRLDVDANVQANASYVVTLDFDANRSVVQTGNASFSLKPVIRTSTTATAGFVAGVVLPLSTKATVWAYCSTGDTLSTNVNLSGEFKLMYVPAGTCTLHISSNNVVYADSNIAGVSINALATANVGTILMRTAQ